MLAHINTSSEEKIQAGIASFEDNVRLRQLGRISGFTTKDTKDDLDELVPREKIGFNKLRSRRRLRNV